MKMTPDYSKHHYLLKREDILKFPFPFKLWIIVNLPSAEFLNWTLNGLGIVIKFSNLQNYLQSPRSIFLIRTSAKFVQHLKEFQFKANPLPPGVEIVLNFSHPCFQRQRLDLVSQIRRFTFFNMDNAQSVELKQPTRKTISVSPSANVNWGDLCFMEHGFLHESQKRRIKNITINVFERETKVLKEKLKISDTAANQTFNSKRGRSACLEREHIVFLPKNVYENPQESMLGKSGYNGRNYGGFYGNFSDEQIKTFFGEYLPKIDDNGIIKVKKFKEIVNDIEDSVLETNDISRICSIDLTSLQSEITINESVPQQEITYDVKVSTSSETNDSVSLTNILAEMNSNTSLTFNVSRGTIEFDVVQRAKSTTDTKHNTSSKALSGDDKTIDVPSTVEQTTNQENHCETNKDFYDELRATFELLQNQN